MFDYPLARAAGSSAPASISAKNQIEAIRATSIRLMKVFFRMAGALGIGVLAAAAVFVPSTAEACGTGGDFAQPVISVRPSNASLLLQQASNLERQAASLDAQASTFQQRASDANVDARAIRVQASTSESIAERDQLLHLAGQLASQASANQSTATALRRQATALRDEARQDRIRAAQLNGGGGSWRGRPIPRMSSPTARI